MDIIEKLGISEYLSTFSKDHEEFVVPVNVYYDVFNQRNEMLEALIGSTVYYEEQYQKYGSKSHDGYQYLLNKQIIQKATNKSWEEIKQILEGDK